MFREAHAIWEGGPYAGQGVVSTPGGTLNHTTYAFGSLNAPARYTTSCDMLAAAIASSMSTTVATEMARVQIRPDNVDCYVILTLDNPGEKWRIVSVHLEIKARTLSDFEPERFQQAVENAQRECPIWSALKVSLTCEAKLTSLTASAHV